MIVRLICYDIENDNCRDKVAKKLEAWGYVRFQYSVFCGKHSPLQWQSLWTKIKAIIEKYGSEKDKIYSIVLSSSNVKKMHCVGEPPDLDLILDDIKTLWI